MRDPSLRLAPDLSARHLACACALASWACAIASCTGTLGPSADRDATASTFDAGRPDAPGIDAAPTDAPGADAPGIDAPGIDARAPIDTGVEPSIDAGPCGSMLASSLSLSPIAGASAGAMAAPTTGGGAVLASRSGSGITLQRVDGAGALFGAAIDVAGDGLWGVAAAPDALAALVSRGDELVLVVRGFDGGAIGESRLLGAVPHDVVGNEWFGTGLRSGRLDWDGAQWVVYATVQRLWPDMIAHYGDTLRTFARDGAPSGTLWDWGCSHSMDVRLAHNAAGIGPLCSSDCYPEKGVFFMHRTTVFLDASGNCAGYVQQRLGGLAAVAGGFVAGWTSAEGRASVDAAAVRIGDDRAIGTVHWLSSAAGDETELHLGSYGAGAVAAWIEGGAGRIVRLDASGTPVGAVETIAASAIEGASDFFVLSDGDTGWVVNGQLARLRACE